MKYFFVTFIPKFFKGFAIFAPAIKKYPQKEKEQKKIRLSDAFSALFFSLFMSSKNLIHPQRDPDRHFHHSPPFLSAVPSDFCLHGAGRPFPRPPPVYLDE